MKATTQPVILVLPEQTEDGAACGEGDQRETVSQSVQRSHDHVEDQLQTQRDGEWRYPSTISWRVKEEDFNL